MTQRILLCCRGEIAMRFIRTCTMLHIETVVIHADDDKHAPFVMSADYRYCVPKWDLDTAGEDVLSAASYYNVDLIAPGYGPLAENAAFAQACEDAGYIFVGPSPAAIRLTGDKLRAREAAEKAGIAVVPGGHPVSDIVSAKELAFKIGYPVILKATQGGGGRGIRVVSHADEFESKYIEIRQESLSAFGSSEVYIEKYLGIAIRHIEVQLIGDKLGNIVHLGTRTCSVQRRRQKIAEEAPSPKIDSSTESKMLKAALAMGKTISYDSAGTVEFLLDASDNFYFIEMNARIQVEHTITEAISNIDIVEEMINSANGLPLRHNQADICLSGHAIEYRICAEDPRTNFSPTGGVVTSLRTPEGPGVRVDSGIDTASLQSIHYDSLCAKLIVWGRDRKEAISRSTQALSEFRLSGFPTNIPFHVWLIKNKDFLEGDYDLSLFDQFNPAQACDPQAPTTMLIALALATSLTSCKNTTTQCKPSSSAGTPAWKLANNAIQG